MIDSNGNNPSQHYHPKPDNNKNDADHTSRIKKLQRKTTLIALLILVAITFGVIGLGIAGIDALSANSNHALETQSAKGAKALTMLTREKENKQPGLTTNLPDAWDAQRNDSEAIKELNRLHAQKIKGLKRQLNEANHKLHEIKADLFTKGDPADRKRLVEISQALVNKSLANEEFQKTIAALEEERGLKNKKIVRMEQTIDALASMTDTQRESKEKAIFNFQSQIERLEEDAKRERGIFEKTVANLEDANTDLKEMLASKISTIKTLEDEVSWQYGALQEKEQDLKSQNKLYAQSESHLKNEVKNLSDTLELEMLKNHNLTDELDGALTKGKAQEQYTKSLENQLNHLQIASQQEKEAWKKNRVDLAKEHIELQGILDVYTHAHDRFATKHDKLKILVREEKAKSEMLKSELESALAAADAEQQRGFCIEEELHATAHKALRMEDELKNKQADIESKQQELDMLAYSNASLRDQLHAKIDQLTVLLTDAQKEVRRKEAAVRDLTINVELERTRIQELDHSLQEALAKNLKETETIHTLQEQIQQKSEMMAAMEERLKGNKSEIEELQNQLFATKSEYEQEKARTDGLHHALSDSLNENETIYDNYAKLQNTAKESAGTLSLLEERIESKKRMIDELQGKLDEVNLRLKFEQRKNKEMEIALDDFKNQRETDSIRARVYKDENEEAVFAIHSLQEQIAEKEGRIEELHAALDMHEEQVEALIAHLEEEREHSNRLEGQFYEANIASNFKESELEKMEQTIVEQNKQIRTMQTTIAKLGQKIELEQHRALAYEKATVNEANHARQLEERLEQFAARIQQMQEAMQMKEEQIAGIHGESKEERHWYSLDDSNVIAYNVIGEDALLERGDVDENADDAEDVWFEHTVKDGENLPFISTYYYGTPDRWTDIYEANRELIPDQDFLEPGITLVIPH